MKRLRKAAPAVGPTIGRIVMVAYHDAVTGLSFKPGIVTKVYPNVDGKERIQAVTFGAFPGSETQINDGVPHGPEGWLWTPYEDTLQRSCP